MSVKLSDLTSNAQRKAELALAELRTIGVPCVVTYTLRTDAEQRALYAQGRKPLSVVNILRKTAGMYPLSEKENKYTVTNCDGDKHKSAHQSGNAIDVVPLEKGKPVWPSKSDSRWIQISNVFKAHGFKWGGDWKEFQDYPHYQL